MIHFLHSSGKLGANEWFILSINVINLIVFFKLPKKFPVSITILIFLFGLTMAKTANFIFGIPPYNLYEINNTTDELDLIDLLLSAIYPPFSYYFLYIYTNWKFKGISLFLYIVIAAVLSVGFEYVAILANVFQYKGWKLFYSFPVYLISLSLALLFFRLLIIKIPKGNI
jgi:hypothetical protein